MIPYGHIELYYTVMKSSYTRIKSNDNLNWKSMDINKSLHFDNIDNLLTPETPLCLCISCKTVIRVPYYHSYLCYTTA